MTLRLCVKWLMNYGMDGSAQEMIKENKEKCNMYLQINI